MALASDKVKEHIAKSKGFNISLINSGVVSELSKLSQAL